MTETERAAWAALEAWIVEDAIAAGAVDSVADVAMLNRWHVEMEMERVRRYAARIFAADGDVTITPNGDGTWNHTFTPKESIP